MGQCEWCAKYYLHMLGRFVVPNCWGAPLRWHNFLGPSFRVRDDMQEQLRHAFRELERVLS
jgi:hypothetical protein